MEEESSICEGISELIDSILTLGSEEHKDKHHSHMTEPSTEGNSREEKD